MTATTGSDEIALDQTPSRLFVTVDSNEERRCPNSEPRPGEQTSGTNRHSHKTITATYLPPAYEWITGVSVSATLYSHPPGVHHRSSRLDSDGFILIVTQDPITPRAR